VPGVIECKLSTRVPHTKKYFIKNIFREERVEGAGAKEFFSSSPFNAFMMRINKIQIFLVSWI